MKRNGRLSRRKLMWIGGAGLAAGAAGGWWAIQPRRRKIVDTNAERVERFQTPLSVAVVGGGLAGMSAALELAERGASVTLIESASHLGGKLGGWPIEIRGESYPMEHGFHGFFAQYYNLDDVLARLGLHDELVPAPSYPMLFREGQREEFESGSSGFPLNLLEFYAGSNNLELGSMLATSPELNALLQYTPDRSFASYDEISFEAFCEAGIEPDLVEYFFHPFAKTTLNNPRNTSAAHVLRFFHFYFLGNPEGLSFRYTRDDSMTSIVRPWRAQLERLGVRVLTGTPASALRLEQDRVTGVVLGRLPSEASELARFEPHTIGAGPRRVGTDELGAPLFAVRLDGDVVALRGRCTHQGCPLRAVSDGFSCPCHGGRFDRRGEPVAGPPTRALDRLIVRDDRIFDVEPVSRVLDADAVVLATDVRGTQRIIGASPVPRAVASKVAALREADPYVVVRLWFDRPVPGEEAAFFTTAQYELLDSIGIYDRLQRPARDWAQRHGGSVVELHSYAVLPESDRGPQGNRDVLVEEFFDCMPEYAGAQIVHEEVMQQSNFSGFRPGSHAGRPGITCEADNLFFAGDWVRTGLPVALMEAAVTTGRLAANEIMSAHGVRNAPVETVALRGPLA